jgi:hypothetical protein
MGTFVEAVLVGIGGAVVLGFAYWGILVLLQPGLDRLRVVVHGKPLAAIPGVVASMAILPEVQSPRAVTPPQPTLWRKPTMPRTIGQVPDANLVKGLLNHMREEFVGTGIFRAAIVGADVLSAEFKPVSRAILRDFGLGGPLRGKGIAESFVMGKVVAPRPQVLLGQNRACLIEGAQVHSDPLVCSVFLDANVALGMMAEIDKSVFTTVAKDPWHPDQLARLGTPDDISMSKLRMRFNPPRPENQSGEKGKIHEWPT